jgi:hypothetical protein
MGEVAAANPDDVEASVLHALLTSANFDPADRTYANQMRAAEILEPLFAEHPDHPGVAHYLIHTYDYPPLASTGSRPPALRRDRAGCAARPAHAVAHLHPRRHWKESIESNRVSAEVDGGSSYNSHHAYDYKVYAHLQLAQDRRPRRW